MIDPASFDPERFAARAAAASRLLKSLGNERRLMILCQLAGGEMTVGALLPRIGVSQSALSQHLAVLRAEGLVATRRAGQTIHYAICDPAVAQVMATLAAIFCPEDVEVPRD
jgi:ArsR family transcriptional regulator